jgi:lipoate-protein ligase A
VCIGCHQDAGRELDLAFCRTRGLRVVRRETGGGAVWLDDRQLFAQWVMDPARLPLRVDRRFALFCQPLVATYRALGVAAVFRPVNDVHVGDRKISGTGAGQIGGAEVVTGNFLFDFDTALMAQVVRAPSAAFRDLVARSLGRYMTSLRQELATVPPRAEVAVAYARCCAAALGAELVAGELTEAEQRSIAAEEERLADPAFVAAAGGMRRPGLKIHEDVYVAEVGPRPGGPGVRITARVRAGRIEEVDLHGGGAGCTDLAAALVGLPLAAASLQDALARYNASRGQRLEVEAWTAALLDLGQPRQDHP